MFRSYAYESKNMRFIFVSFVSTSFSFPWIIARNRLKSIFTSRTSLQGKLQRRDGVRYFYVLYIKMSKLTRSRKKWISVIKYVSKHDANENEDIRIFSILKGWMWTIFDCTSTTNSIKREFNVLFYKTNE